MQSMYKINKQPIIGIPGCFCLFVCLFLLHLDSNEAPTSATCPIWHLPCIPVPNRNCRSHANIYTTPSQIYPLRYNVTTSLLVNVVCITSGGGSCIHVSVLPVCQKPQYLFSYIHVAWNGSFFIIYFVQRRKKKSMDISSHIIPSYFVKPKIGEMDQKIKVTAQHV